MRRIRKAKISFISLVPKGANKIEPVYKDDGSFVLGSLVKASDTFDEHGELLAVVYAPNFRDSQGDIADAAVVKQMAYDFISNGGSIDICHDGKAVPAEKARVGETFLVQKTDTRFHGWKDGEGKSVDLTDAWAAIIKIDDPDLRKMYRSGEWAGVSMGGTAIVEHEKADHLERMLEKVLNHLQPQPEIMDEKTILKAITDGISTLSTELVKALKPAEAPEKKKEVEGEKAPIFKGSWDNPRDITKHARAVQMFQLRTGTDFSDPASLMSYREAISVLKEDWAKEDAEAGIEETAPAARRAGPSVGSGPGSSGDLNKDLIEAAKEIAKAHNTRNLKKVV